MNLIQKIMGRRQFLIATGAISTSVLASKKLADMVAPGFQTRVASASEKTRTVMNAPYSSRYSHLLSPLKIRNVMLKNRMISTNALPHFMQGPETFPADPIISYLGKIAKSGAAIVTITNYTDSGQRSAFVEDAKHFPMFDPNDPSVGNYFSQLADVIHFYDSKVSVGIMPMETHNFEPRINTTPGNTDFDSLFGVADPSKVSKEMMNGMIKEAVRISRYYQSLGFDMVSIMMGYNQIGLAKFLSPLKNKRTDEYGGSIGNRARLPLEMCQSIKEACGEHFLVEAVIKGEEDAGGITIEDTVAFAKLAEGKIDIFQIRAGSFLAQHPNGFNSTEGHPVTLHVAEAIKKSGAKIITAPVGGYQNLDDNEAYIASGKTDMIAMGRAFIVDPEYGTKAYEGRGEDVVPCQRCAKCHVPYMKGPWLFMCSGNPVAGLANRISWMTDAPKTVKKVAVIGGGPAGMKAAIVAAERGHKVTLYEKNDFLGGQLIHADFPSFRWPLRNFKNYLVRQTNKMGIEVLLDTEATPEIIRTKGYDAVLVAVGAEPVIPDIPGAHGDNVWTPIGIYGHEKTLGNNVVVIGGSQIGVETGMYLAECGHRVTVVTEQGKLAPDATQIHYIEMAQAAWEKMANFSYVLKAAATGISDGNVTYIDANSHKKTIEADSVVISAGLKPRHEEAAKFYGSAGRFFIIGDCRAVGNVQKCMRSAFAAASLI